MTGPLFGSHLSVAGGMVNALLEAERLGFETVQVFTKNQQQWNAKPLSPGVVDDWRGKLAGLGWAGRTVSHASYLINLASPDDELWEKSIALMLDEIGRCETLGIAFLVHHPGAYTSSDRDAGLRRIAEAYRRLLHETPDAAVVVCLENTVGTGSNLGRPFEELAELRSMIADRAGGAGRVGFCFDTCHAHAGGYDMAERGAGEAVLDEFGRVCGLEHLRVVHLNDSKAGVGSRKDRHEHIGRGTIGRPPGPRGGARRLAIADTGFAAVVNRPELAGVPMILETPKGEDGRGVEHDRRNLGALRRALETG